mgnify:CR=1 FL=1
MKSFFYGWYFKCQSDTQTFAVIPAIHQGKNGRTCSIQIITDTEVQKIAFSSENFCKRKKSLFIGKNQFHCSDIVKFYSLFIYLSFLQISQYDGIYGRLLIEK